MQDVALSTQPLSVQDYHNAWDGDVLADVYLDAMASTCGEEHSVLVQCLRALG